VAGRAAYRAGQRRGEGDAEPPQAPAPENASPPPTAGGMAPDTITQLKELGELHEQGILTDEEFTQQKSRILDAS
jgi:hypothetical protein